MADYGNGSVYKRKDGKWVAAIVVNGKKRVRYAKSEREAHNRLKDLWQDAGKEEALQTIAAASPETLPEAANDAVAAVITVSAFAEQWLASASIKVATRESYRDTLRAYILPLIGDMPLDTVKPQDVARIITTVLHKGKSSRTAQYSYMITRRLLQVAFDWDFIPTNPAAKVKRPKAEHAERVTWSIPQTEAFIAASHGDVGAWNDMFLTALLTGLRLGELLGLAWRDVDWEGGALSVKRVLVELHGGIFSLQTPKTKAAIRTIALSPLAITTLRRRYEAAGPPEADAYVFRRASGFTQSRSSTADAKRVPSKQTLSDALDRACKRAGVPRVTMHGLRHQHISLLAHAGVPIKVAQQRAGHSSPVVTLAVYTHVIGDADRQAAKALDRMLGGTPEPEPKRFSRAIRKQEGRDWQAMKGKKKGGE